VLVAEAAHPGPRALAGAGEIVGEEDADMAVGILHFPGANVRMVGRQVGAFDEAQAEQPAGGVEGGLLDVLEHEVWLQLALVDGIVGLADAFGVVAPVPRLDAVVDAVGAGDGEQAGALAGDSVPGRGPDLVCQAFDVGLRRCHGVGEAEFGIG
jgi:hypothetical protein